MYSIQTFNRLAYLSAYTISILIGVDAEELHEKIINAVTDSNPYNEYLFELETAGSYRFMGDNQREHGLSVKITIRGDNENLHVKVFGENTSADVKLKITLHETSDKGWIVTEYLRKINISGTKGSISLKNMSSHPSQEFEGYQEISFSM